jgi:hypothetical protein
MLDVGVVASTTWITPRHDWPIGFKGGKHILLTLHEKLDILSDIKKPI